MLPLLNERQRRIFLAAEAQTYGRGGITRVCEITGSAPFTIRQGIAEINGEEPPAADTHLRAPGGGRKKLETTMPDLDDHILQIVDGATYGNPEKVLSYTTLSLRSIQEKLLNQFGEDISFRSIGTILGKLGYSKQTNQKMLQVGESHPDRNQQFEFINNKASRFLKERCGIMISLYRNWARSPRMGFTYSTIIPDSSTLALIMIRQNLRLKAFCAGG